MQRPRFGIVALSAVLLACGGDAFVGNSPGDAASDATVAETGTDAAMRADGAPADGSTKDAAKGDSGGGDSGQGDSGGGDSGGDTGGGTDAGADDGGNDAEDSGGFPGCTPSGETCNENIPNGPPTDPPNTPCCDGVCNHGTIPSHCGCGGVGGPCSNLSFLYGPDCCAGLTCLDTGTSLQCGMCRQDGQSCMGSAQNCCHGLCNTEADICGCVGAGIACVQDEDCCNSGTCVGQKCCFNDTLACAANADCCGGICNAATGKCGCGTQGTSCSKAADCCGPNPFCNSLGQCGCVVNTMPCKTATDCCGGLCNSATSTCGCSAVSKGCNTGADCCSGLTCGSTTKKCCKAAGALCTLGSDCCSNSCKGNGTCQ